MNVLVLGAGQVGLGVAQYLKNRDVDVAIIEKSSELVFKIRNSSDINIIHGDAIDVEVLKKANAENSGHVIATLSHDEQNLVACKIVESIFNVKTRIARIRSNSFLRDEVFELFLKDNFGVDELIHPELEVAHYISNIASLNGVFDVIKSEYVTVVGLKCQESSKEVLNTTFKHFPNITDLELAVLSINRAGETFFPTGDDVLLLGDEVYVAMPHKNVDDVLALFGYFQTKNRNILVVGGGNIGIFAAKGILSRNEGANITILEKSKERAEEIALRYPNITTILGDALNYVLLKEISFNIDTVIVATDHDKVNILSSLFFKQLNVGRILALSKSRNYDSLLTTDSGYSVIDPSIVTIEAIVQKTRKGKITSVMSFKSAHVVGAEISESCANRTVKSFYKSKKVIPFFVIRGDNFMFAKKDTVLVPNDKIVLLVAKGNLKIAEEMFSSYLFSPFQK